MKRSGIRPSERFLCNVAQRHVGCNALALPFRIGGRQCWCQYRFAAWLAAGCPEDQPENSEIPRRCFRTADSIRPLLTTAEAAEILDVQKIRVKIGGLVRCITHHNPEVT